MRHDYVSLNCLNYFRDTYCCLFWFFVDKGVNEKRKSN